MSIAVVDRLEVRHPDVLDVESRDCLIARRNVLLGLWAASCLGLPDNEVEAYAWSVHLTDFEAPGHDDVVKKLVRDFAARGKDIREQSIRTQLREMELRAFLQLWPEVTSRPNGRRTGRIRMRARYTANKSNA